MKLNIVLRVLLAIVVCLAASVLPVFAQVTANNDGQPSIYRDVTVRYVTGYGHAYLLTGDPQKDDTYKDVQTHYDVVYRANKGNANGQQMAANGRDASMVDAYKEPIDGNFGYAAPDLICLDTYRVETVKFDANGLKESSTLPKGDAITGKKDRHISPWSIVAGAAVIVAVTSDRHDDYSVDSYGNKSYYQAPRRRQERNYFGSSSHSQQYGGDNCQQPLYEYTDSAGNVHQTRTMPFGSYRRIR